MNKANTDIVNEIRSLIDGYKADTEEFSKDRTVDIARQALADAEAAKQRADIDDDSIGADELVDRRLEAGRAVEIAKITLQRAERVANERAADVPNKIIDAKHLLCEALTSAADPLRESVWNGLKRVLGDDYQGEKSFFKSMVYRMADRLFSTSRHINQSSYSHPSQLIHTLERGIALLEDAYRDR